MPAANLHLRRGIIFAGILLACAFSASSAYDAWRLRQQVLAANDRELGNLVRSLAYGFASNLEAVDLVLQETATWYERSGSIQDAATVSESLAARAVGMTQVSLLTIVDADGLQRHRSRQTGHPLADVSDRPYFQVQRSQSAAGLYINSPVVTRTEGLPALVTSRRINAPDGSFHGVVTAIVTLKRLEGMYSAIRLGAGDSLAVTLKDGAVVVRLPGAHEAGTSLGPRDAGASTVGPPVGSAAEPGDGLAKLVSVADVGGYPLTLTIARDRTTALRPWVDAARGFAIRPILISLLISLAVTAALRQLRRQETSAQALRESEERYALAMDAANEGHAEWNLQSDTVFACPKWRALHGVDEHARVQTPMDAVQALAMNAEDAATAKAAIEEHIAGGSEMVDVEYRVKVQSGEWRWIHARGRCLMNDAHAPVRLFCSAVDVNERKAAEVERAELNSRLLQARQFEALGTLAGGIAHDFNNILGAILGFGQMAQQQVDADSPARRHIDRVLEAGARARLLVRRILDFSRSGVSERALISVQQVVEEVVGMLSPSLPPGVSLSTRLQAGGAAVMGDATQLHQVVMNVCTNAAQAMDDEGVIEIALQRVDLVEDQVLLQGTLSPGPHVRLDVEDGGVGISPAVVARMFDPFFTTKKVGEGTGLGMSVVHGIVSDMRGAIDVAARPERGTRVSIWFPVVGNFASPGLDISADLRRGNGEVVMVVDDEPALVELAEELLADLSYEPIGFNSSEAALRALNADPNRFDAVLTDEAMPGLRGTELTAAIAGLRADLPIVLMSGNLSPDVEKRARELGVREFLHKPVSSHALSESLARTFDDRPASPKGT